MTYHAYLLLPRRAIYQEGGGEAKSAGLLAAPLVAQLLAGLYHCSKSIGRVGIQCQSTLPRSGLWNHNSCSTPCQYTHSRIDRRV